MAPVRCLTSLCNTACETVSAVFQVIVFRSVRGHILPPLLSLALDPSPENCFLSAKSVSDIVHFDETVGSCERYILLTSLLCRWESVRVLRCADSVTACYFLLSVYMDNTYGP